MNHEDLRYYYEKLFPCEEFCRWLGGSRTELLRREFSVTLPGDVYCRYQVYGDGPSFRSALVSQVPEKIDIGAIFSACPKGQATGKPVARELVFDIDMDDYDTIRRCCQGGTVCEKCWTWMACAKEILQTVLQEDFGFSDLLFVFSGRRGLHCWTSDEEAKKLPDADRAAIAEYLNLLGARQSAAKTQRHPVFKKAFDICLKYFEQRHTGILEGQDLHSHPEFRKKIFEHVPDELKFHLEDARNSRDLWQRVQELLRSNKWKNPKISVEEIVLEFTFPRLDINVSTHMNHLLKAPFCIHPKTGKLCTPVTPDFALDKVPKLADIVEEHRNRKSPARADEYLKFFEKFVQQVERSRAAGGASQDGMEF